MYNVSQGLWGWAALPMSLQAALGRASALQNGKFADQVQIVPTVASDAAHPLLDLYV